MFKLCIISLFIYLAASDETLLNFDPQYAVLAECIEQQLVIFDNTFESTRIANETAYLAARRFHGKSMPKNKFDRRFIAFYHNLRNGIIKNGLETDQFSKTLRVSLKQALIICADNTTVKNKVKTQSEDLISFRQNKSLLFECIEIHLGLTGNPVFILEDGFDRFMADTASKRFHGKSMSKNDFDQRYFYFFKDLRRKKIMHEFEISKLSEEVKSLVKQAIEDCATDKYPLIPVPIFDNEPSKISHILDLMLVKWPNDVYHMIQSKNDRATLRRYASDALTLLIGELHDFQNDTQSFRTALRSFWNKRAREMYDANSAELPYIAHLYSSNYPTPHMVQSAFEKFIIRNSTDFKKRDPEISQSLHPKILNVPTPDRPNSNDNVDIYDSYSNNGITSSEYYFENQLNQFYRILFFSIEVCARGICTDKDDVYDGPYSNNLVPEVIQAIVYDDEIYQIYLLYKRSFFKSLMDNGNSRDNIAQNLFDNTQVLELNLILLMSSTLSTSGIHSRSESITTVTTVRTTTQSLKRKDDVWKNENGKCFPKRTKTAQMSCCSGSNGNFNIEDFKEVTPPTFQGNSFVSDFADEDSSMSFFDEFGASLKREKNATDDLHGYVISNDDSKHIQFTSEDLFVIQDMSCFSDS